MANKRLNDLPEATESISGDVVAIDGLTTRRITVENLLGGTLQDIKDNGIPDPVYTGVREMLTADRTYYVRTDGSDISNNGLSNTAGGAFLTYQKAIDVVMNGIDGAGYSVAIVGGAGTFTGANTVSGKPVGVKSFTISGAGATTIIQVASSSCFYCSNGAIVTLSNMKLSTTTSGDEIYADSGSKIYVSGITYGTSAGFHNVVGLDGYICMIGACTIAGNSTAFLHIPFGGKFFAIGTFAVNLSTSIVWGNYFLGLRGPAYAYFSPGVTFTGSSATGVRAVVHAGSMLDIDTKIATFLPGSTPMVVQSGGTIFAGAAIFAIGGSATPITMKDGMFVDISDSSGAQAIIAYPLLPSGGTPRVVWENVAGTFVTSDPGAGANKWWVQPNGLFTNRFVGINTMTLAPRTNSITDNG